MELSNNYESVCKCSNIKGIVLAHRMVPSYWTIVPKMKNLYSYLPIVYAVLLSMTLPVDCYVHARSPRGVVRSPIHWNATNPIFLSSNNYHVMEVNLYDEVDIICPLYSEDVTNMEYYVIYQVTKEQYDSCTMHDTPLNYFIINCSQPRHQRYFTLIFERFIPDPNYPQFAPGQTYYYITMSSGTLEGVGNTNQLRSACYTQNMKLQFKVCCDSTSGPSSEPSTTRLPAVPSTTRPIIIPAQTTTKISVTTTQDTHGTEDKTTKKTYPGKDEENETVDKDPTQAGYVNSGTKVVISVIPCLLFTTLQLLLRLR